MLKKNKNAFLKVIQDSGLDPALFSAEDQDKYDAGLSAHDAPGTYGGHVFKIKLANTPLEFHIVDEADFNTVSYRHSRFVPGFHVWSWERKKDVANALAAFKDWLDDVVRRYIEDDDLPDYWAQLKDYQSIVTDTDIPAGKSADFTDEEKEWVRQSVGKFRQLVKENFNPTPEQEAFINERLDYLSKAVDRMSRFDWRGAALSALVSIAVNLSVDTGGGKHLFTLFQQAFRSVKGLLH